MVDFPLQISFAAGELSPGLDGRVDLGRYAVGLRRAENVFVHPQGGVSNRSGTRFVGEGDSVGGRLIKFVFSREETHVLNFGDYTLRVFDQGQPVLNPDSSIYEITTPYSAEEAKQISTVQSADVIYIAHANHPPHKLERHGLTDWRLVEIDFSINTQAPELAWSYASTHGTSSGNYRMSVQAVYADGTRSDATFTDPLKTSLGPAGSVLRIFWQEVPGATKYKVTRGNPSDTRIVATIDTVPGQTQYEFADYGISSQSTLSPITGVGPGPVIVDYNNDGRGFRRHRYKVTAINSTTGEESLAQEVPLDVSNYLEDGKTFNSIGWFPVPEADLYTVYKEENGKYGFIGSTPETKFKDDNILPDLSESPPEIVDPFPDNDWPSSVALYEERLVFSGMRKRPRTILMSNTAAFEAFSVSEPQKPDDAVTFSLLGREVNEIRHIVPLQDLVVLTSGGEWRVTGQDGGPITPGSILARAQSYDGTDTIAPLVVSNSVLFVQDQGRAVRDLTYQIDADGFAGEDLTILSRHLFDGRRIVDWAYAKTPDSIIWMVMDDGTVLSLTFIRSQKLVGWARHDFGGSVESVTAIPEDGIFKVYFLIKRTIDGQDRYYVEQMQDRSVDTLEDSFFLDCAIRFDEPAPIATISGLDHLEGQTVTGFADNHVFEGLVVTSGQVTFPTGVRKGVIGLPYQATLETLPVRSESQPATGMGRVRRVGAVTLKVHKTVGLKTGTEENNLLAFKDLSVPVSGQVESWVSGDVRVAIFPQWDKDGAIIVRQDKPLPMTVLSAAPDVEFGG